MTTASSVSARRDPGVAAACVSAPTRSVLVVTFDFPPSAEVGAYACSQLTRYLPEYGWEPVVLTVEGRYHLNRNDAEGARAFPGPIIRTAALPHPLDVWARLRRAGPMRAGTASAEVSSVELGRLRRWVISLLTLPDRYTGWLPVAIARGITEVRRRDIAHIFSSAPHWTNHLVALAIATATRRRWTAHFRDPWIGIPSAKPVSRLSLAIEERLERLVVTCATNVVCVTEQHTAWLRQRYPMLAPEKFSTVTNGFDAAEWDSLAAPSADRTAPADFVITYAGTLYQTRNPLPLFRALRRLIDSREIDERRLRVDLIGWCDVAEGTLVSEAARTLGLADSVRVVGAVSRSETLRHLLGSDLLLLLAEAQPYQIPGKTFEYLRARRPILALTRSGAVTELLHDVPGVHIVDPDDIAGIAAAVRAVYHQGEEGSSAPMPDTDFVSQFDRRRLAGQLARVLDAGTPVPVARRHAPGVRS